MTGLFLRPWAIGRWSLHQCMGLLVGAYQTGSCINIYLGLSQRDVIASCLNHCDTALAYAALSYLASFVGTAVPRAAS